MLVFIQTMKLLNLFCHCDRICYIQVELPPKLNPFVCDEDSDVESNSEESDGSDDESDGSEDESGSDKSYIHSSSDSSGSSSGSAMEVDPPVLPDDDDDDTSILTARNAGKWCERWLSTDASQTLVMTKWRDDLKGYLLCTDTPEVSYILVPILIYSNYTFEVAEANLGMRQQAAVVALREMRAVKKSYFNKNSWRRKVKV